MGAEIDRRSWRDYSIASDTPVFGAVFIKQAITAGTVMSPRHLGLKRATEMLFEGEVISAEEAFALGLVSRVCKESELDAEVSKLAEKLAAGATRTIGLIKHSLNRAYFPALKDELQVMASLQQIATKSDHSVEARASSRQHRKPVIAGR